MFCFIVWRVSFPLFVQTTVLRLFTLSSSSVSGVKYFMSSASDVGGTAKEHPALCKGSFTLWRQQQRKILSRCRCNVNTFTCSHDTHFSIAIAITIGFRTHSMMMLLPCEHSHLIVHNSFLTPYFRCRWRHSVNEP